MPEAQLPMWPPVKYPPKHSGKVRVETLPLEARTTWRAGTLLEVRAAYDRCI